MKFLVIFRNTVVFLIFLFFAIDNLYKYGLSVKGAQDIDIAQYEYEKYKRDLGADHPDSINQMNILANLKLAKSDFADAIVLFEELIELRKKNTGHDSIETMNSMLDYAKALRDVGQIDKAVLYINKVKSINNGIDEELNGKISNDLAEILFQQKKFKDAIEHNSSSYEYRKKHFGISHELTIQSMTNLAISLMYESIERTLIGDETFEEGLSLLRQARSLAKKNLLDTHNLSLRIDGFISQFDSKLTAQDKVQLQREVYLNKELVSGANHPLTLDAMFSLALTYTIYGHSDKAIKLIDNRNERFEYWYQKQKDLLSLDELNTLIDQNKRALNLHFVLLQLLEKSEDALKLADRNKARYLFAQLSQQNALDKANISVADRQAYDQFRQDLAEVNERLAQAQDDESSIGELLKRQRDLLQQQSQLIKRLQDTYPVFAQYSRPKTLDLDQARSLMQQHLPKGSVVSFWQDGELNNAYFAFIMDADGKVATQRIEKDNLKRSLQAYREITAFHGSLTDYMKATRKTLWRHADGSFEVSDRMPAKLTFKDRVMHIEPLQAYISDSLLGPIWSNIADAKSLLISPDSDLALVAFEALTTPNGKRLIEEKDISYTPSLSIWINTHQRQASYNQQQRRSLLTLANPDYSQQQSALKAVNSSLPMTTQRGQTVQRDQLFWVDLPGTEIEAKRIASIYPDLTLKTGKDASKHWLVEQNQTGTLKQYKQLHFATHGYLDDSDPMQSSLVLSFDQGKAQAYLSAQDIYKLDLQSDLTVLSACNTAANEAKAGVGVVGLPFALYMAGNQSTLMTLWSVNDEATAAYMQRFYELVKQGIKPAQANSQVKREFLTQAKYAGVNIWAPFVYYGN